MMQRVVAGVFLGLAWGAAMRAWMTLLALGFGDRPEYTWLGTFGAILLPAALMGAVLGWAAYAAEPSAETLAGKRWRWAICSPLVMVLAPAILLDDFIPTLLTTGMGSGAIAVALVGLLGGYALSGFGASWLRWLSGLLALLLTFASAIGPIFVNGIVDIRQSADEVFGGLFFILLMVFLIAGVGAPFRYRSK